MALTPLTTLVGAAAPLVARTTLDATRQLVAARPFSQLLEAGGEVLQAGGEVVRDVFAPEEPSETTPTADDPLAPLREEAQAALALLAGRIEERLAQAGVDLSLPLEFEIAPGGQLTLASTHPHKEQIEALVARDAEIGDLATYVEATQKLLHTSDTQSELLTRDAGRTLGSLERRAADLAGQSPETLHVTLHRGELELEYR